MERILKGESTKDDDLTEVTTGYSNVKSTTYNENDEHEKIDLHVFFNLYNLNNRKLKWKKMTRINKNRILNH